MGPQILERVISPSFGVEQVDYDRPVVEQNPTAFVVAFDAHPLVGQFAFQDAVDFFADGVQLPSAVARHENEVIEFRRHAPHVEDRDILTAIVLGGAGGRERQLAAAFLASFKSGRCFADGMYFLKSGR
jgi:hypothetical protein